ncbi:MAG: T9SS type A sorting domain-containing protein [Bacteroidetes bacterium]|nr:T9SS type A sorting domain-containing protein [Bacteroidota bacterium]
MLQVQPGAVFSWTRGAVIGINNDTASFGNSNLIQEVLLNNTDSIKTITYNISISTADTCTFNVQAITVTVYPAPKLSNVVTGFSTCNDAVFNFTATSNTQGTITYVWKRDSVQGITPYTSSGTGNTISEALNNSTPFIQVVTYAMTIIANNCSTIQHVTDTVFPTPLLTDTILADTICSGSSYVYNASSLTPGVVFSWSRAAVPNINGGLPANGSSSLIQDTLINSTNTVITVTYSVGLTAYGCPTNFQNITVAVNPTPLLSNTVLLKDSVCSGKLFLRNLSANISNTSFEWVRNPVLGISPLSNSGNTANISETLVNANSFAIDVTYIVKLTTPEGCINTQNIIVTVLPKPVLLDSVKRDTICSGSVYSYIGLSATSNTTLVWQRSPVSGIIPLSAVGTTNLIKDSIINITASPIVVKYFYTITSASGCIGLDSIELLVNPTPFIYDSSSSVCSGLQFQYEIVPLYATSNIFYSWTSDSVVNITGNNPQLPELPNAFIEDTLNNNLNNTIIPVKYNIIATYIDNNVRCQSSAVFTVNVLPLPKPPLFSSLTSNQTEIDLCGGSTNINFNISPSFIQDGVTYIWYALPGPNVFIADTTNPNTVISFDNITNTVQIAVTAYNNDSLGGCFATESQSVNLTVNNDSIQERKIFIKQPGNILVYPDNSMDATYTDSTGTVNGYQWGYDTIPSILKPDSLGVPLAIAGQVYQFFVPDIKYVDSQGLDTIHYAWWVLLRSGECRSKVYYNGPYAYNRYLEQPAQDNSIKLDIFPNPGNGNFTFMLNGKIYGDITLRVYDNIGQLVFQDLIEKKKYELTSPLKLNNLSDGIYSLELQSKDMQKISTRIIIIHN